MACNYDDAAAHWDAAWALTRQISPRAEVHKAERDAYGEPVNEYTLAHGVGRVVPRSPWLVHLADMEGRFWLVPFDFDVAVAGNPDALERAQDDADALSILLRQLSIAHVVCESSSKGGRHVWVAMTEPADAELVAAIGTAAKAVLPSLDRGMLSNPRRGGARPPLSPHRNGSFSRIVHGTVDSLVVPTTAVQDLRALLDALLVRAPALDPAETTVAGEVRPVVFLRRRSLTAKEHAKLQLHRGGDDPSQTAWHCLLILASNGWTFEEVLAAAVAAPGLEHFRTRRAGEHGQRRPRPAAEMHRKLAEEWQKVQFYVRVRRTAPAGTPKDIDVLHLQVTIAEDLAESFRINPGRWGGRYGGPTRRTVLTALTMLMLRTGKTAIAASTRTLAELCNIDHSTAARALWALVAEGWVARVEAADGLGAATWTLVSTRPVSTASELGATQPLTITPARPLPRDLSPGLLHARRATTLRELESFLANVQHDVFTYRGLGHQVGQIWALMRAGAHWTVEEVARTFCLSVDRVTRMLTQLHRHHLIKKTVMGWTSALRDARRSAAKRLHVTGVLESRRVGHRIDRDVWRWWQNEYQRMITLPRARVKRRHLTDRPLGWGDPEAAASFEWPMYPRVGDDTRGRADHRRARIDVQMGSIRSTILAPRQAYFKVA